MKTVGGILCVAACILWAALYLEEKKRHIEAIQCISNAMMLINGEMSGKLTPLPELIRMAAKSSEGCAENFFLCVERGLSSLGEKNFYEIWDEALLKNIPWLSDEQRRMLSYPGKVLGRGCCETQSEILRNTAGYLNKEAEMMKESYMTTRKLSIGLSISLGLLGVIVLG